MLNGGPLSGFSKVRQEHTSNNFPGVIITLDQVDGLGRYSGRYAEIEVLVPRDGNVEAAREQIAKLARQLFADDRNPVELSYQQMLEKSQSEA
jgi:adenylate cyclase class IV